MTKPRQTLPDRANDAVLLKRELEKGLASGTSQRSPEQVRAAFRRAREAA